MTKVNIAEPTFGVQVGEVDVEGFIHEPHLCSGQFCPFHNPSDHNMVDWAMNIRLDNRALTERICPHGVGHPDPDSVAFFERQGIGSMGVHGCDGCCMPMKQTHPEDGMTPKQRKEYRREMMGN